MTASHDDWKRAAAESAVTQIRDGMIVGLGSGSTAAFAVQAIGVLVRKGLRIRGVPTSERTAELARSLHIPLTGLDEHSQIDVTIDGADEVEGSTLNLIKGLGGALLREKIVASATRRLLIAVDESKLVKRLGDHDPVPVEVVPFGWQIAARRLKDLGGDAVLRRGAGGEPFLSDSGHYIVDCRFEKAFLAEALAGKLDRVVGVVEHGLFLGMATEVHAAGASGARVLNRESSTAV
jgi:ribose 5-phosphate isomerase A